MNRLPSDKAVIRAFAALLLSLVLYIGGLKLFLVPVLLVCMALWLPAPAIFRSLFSRFVVSAVLLFSLFQITAVVQFFVLPTSGLWVHAVLLTAMVAGLMLFFNDSRDGKRQVWFDSKDAAAIAVALFAVVPFMYLCFGSGNLTALGTFAGVQSSDAVNHFMAIAEMAQAEHLTYRTVDYYPKGFHLAVAFIQDTVGLNHQQLSWAMNARIFIAHYVVLGALLAYALFYMCRRFYTAIGGRVSRWSNAVLAVTLGVPASLLYLLPFTYQGFLNYFFVCAAFILGALYLYGFYEQSKVRSQQHMRWFMACYLLFAFGIGMSWPLLTPALVLVPLLYLLPPAWSPRENIAYLVDRRNWVIIAGFALQLMPIYLHMRYSALTAEQGLTAQGSIRMFHYGLLLAGIAVITYVATQKRYADSLKVFVTNIFQPFYLLVGVIAAWHFLRVDEVRYYAIKVGYLVELLVLAAIVALVVELYARGTLHRVHQLFVPVLTVTLAVLLLLSVNGNPLKDVREMFRSVSNFGTPAFYDSDVRKFTDLAVSDSIDNANNTVLHYDPQSGNVYGNLMLANWANVMQYRANVDREAVRCSGRLFPIAMYQAASPEQQGALIAQVRECIALAEKAGRKYYIVTDHASVPQLRGLFGERVQLVTD